MTPQANNLSSDVPTGKADFESAILHELGHCALGQAHPNLGLLTDLVAGQASQADEGPNGVFEINFGPDGQPGSIDDVRGDDINRTWFYKADNYPFLFTTPVDKITYGLELGDLPPGSTFSANANRLSGTVAIPPVIGTEAAMNAYLLTGEGRSVLQHDDAATYRYAASGLDEMEGTADDYTVQLMYQGRTTSNCDVIIEDLPEPGMVAAMCIVSAVGIGGAKQHFRLAGVSQLQISSLVDWYYGPTIFSDGFEGGDLSSWSFSGQ